jgi:hypothetical protein
MISGAKARTTDGTIAWKARSHPASEVPGGNGTFTAVPSAAGPPISSAKPVPGKSASGDSCRLIVSTRGSS